MNKADMITNILAKVSDICNYAIENGNTKQDLFDELELMLKALAI